LNVNLIYKAKILTKISSGVGGTKLAVNVIGIYIREDSNKTLK